MNELLTIASLSTPVLLLILAWLARTWIKARLDDSLKRNTEILLEEMKDRSAKQVALTESRVRAFSKLWEVTKILNPRGDLKLEVEEMEKKLNELREWYYADGNAMHLSITTSNDFLKGLQYLGQENTGDNLKIIKRIFSSVRTRSKEDLGVYDSKDIFKKIPDYDMPLADGTKVEDPFKKA